MEFSEKLRQLLKEKRLSQNDLAEAIGTSQSQVSSWLNSGVLPRSDYLLKSARQLGVTVDCLLDPDQSSPTEVATVTEDEKMILTFYRALGLSRDQALKGLALMVERDSEAKP